jgi:hypothetical protein
VRLRPKKADSILPPELLAGPATPDHHGRRAWLAAGTAWSKANGYGWGGWRDLLPPSVRAEHLPSARERLRRMDEGDMTQAVRQGRPSQREARPPG